MRRSPWLQAVFLLALTGCDEKIVFDEPGTFPDLDMPELGNGKLVITNSASDSLSWIDLDTREEVLRLPVGLLPPEREGPHHLAASPDGKFLFVGITNDVPGAGTGPHGDHGMSSKKGLLLKYEVATGRLVGQTQVQRSPGDVRLTPDGKKVLQTHYDLRLINEVLNMDGPLEDMYASLAIVDADTMRPAFVPVCAAPHGVAVTPDSKTAFVACSSSDELAEVDLETLAVEHHYIGTPPPNPSNPTFQPYAATIQPGTGKVWMSNLGSRDLRIYDPATDTWNATCGPIELGGQPIFPAFSADGSRLYVPVQTLNAFVIIDPATCAIISSLQMAPEACKAPHAVILYPDESRAFVVCEGNHIDAGSVAVVNLGNELTPAVEKSVDIGVFPDDGVLLGVPR